MGKSAKLSKRVGNLEAQLNNMNVNPERLLAFENNVKLLNNIPRSRQLINIAYLFDDTFQLAANSNFVGVEFSTSSRSLWNHQGPNSLCGRTLLN